MSDTVSVQSTFHNPSEVKADIDERLSKYFSDRFEAANKLNPRYGELWAVMRTLALAGGKRLRPYMTVLGYEAYGGKDYPAILDMALAQELLHLSLLIHDDIADNDYVRHGVLNVAGQYQRKYTAPGRSAATADHFANAAALMAGDLLLSAAHTQVQACAFPAGDQLAILELFGQITFEVAGGQHLDMEAVLDDLDAADPLRIARYKTAGYSFVGPLLCGAILAHATEHDRNRIKHAGYTMGIAFQLTDDLLGVFGDDAETGKSNLNDLREGKRTLLAKEAYQRATPAQRQAFKSLFGNTELTESQAQQMRQLMIETGAAAEVESLAQRYSAQALSAINLLSISDEAKQRLAGLVKKLTDRTH